MILGIVRVNNRTELKLDILELIPSHVRVVRDPLMAVYMVVNRHIPELNVFGTLATDIILLLIMSFGLLRLGFHERSASGLEHLSWKQVGYPRFSLAVMFSIR
jgi:hypothetical protein